MELVKSWTPEHHTYSPKGRNTTPATLVWAVVCSDHADDKWATFSMLVDTFEVVSEWPDAIENYLEWGRTQLEQEMAGQRCFHEVPELTMPSAPAPVH